jgi:hypothetical protein
MMKKLLVASVIASVLAASTAFAVELPSSQPIKGTEGPGIRYGDSSRPAPPVRGTEGPDVR